MRILIIASVLFTLITSAASAADFRAAVSIPPQKYLADKITGGRFDTIAIVDPGSNPHNYEPKPRQMVFLSGASVYFSIGIEFEEVWLKRLLSAGKNIRHVDTAALVTRIPVEGEIIEPEYDEHGHDDHDHDHDGDHGHGDDEHGHDHSGLDPHIWLAPENMKIIAREMAKVFTEIDPAGKSVYEKNLADLLGEIDLTDMTITENLKGVPAGTPFMVFHPGWGYFAKTYGLRQVAVEVEGKEPKPALLQELIKYARERNIKVVFVQPQFSRRSAETIAQAIGGEAVAIDNLAYEWSSNLIKVSEIFAKVLKN